MAHVPIPNRSRAIADKEYPFTDVLCLHGPMILGPAIWGKPQAFGITHISLQRPPSCAVLWMLREERR
jgi:hypothetical protein